MKPKKAMITIQLSAETKKRLTAKARRAETSLSAICRTALNRAAGHTPRAA